MEQWGDMSLRRLKISPPSFPRRRESVVLQHFWIPTCVLFLGGMQEITLSLRRWDSSEFGTINIDFFPL